MKCPVQGNPSLRYIIRIKPPEGGGESRGNGVWGRNQAEAIQGLCIHEWDWIGLDWLGWIGLQWIGRAWIGLERIGLDGIGLDRLDWIGLDWIGLDRLDRTDWVGCRGLDWLGVQQPINSENDGCPLSL